MKYEVLSGRGCVKLINKNSVLVVPPYPKLIHPEDVFETKMVAELKWNGYNVRTLKFGDEIVSLTRGGHIDTKTRDMIVDFYGEKLTNFFKDNPSLILCGEVIGKKTMAAYKGVEFDYLIFDIMDLEREEEDRFLGYDEKLSLINKYGFNYVGFAGVFTNIHDTLKWMQENGLPERNGIEGVVLKSLDGKQIFKLRYDMHKELFKDKLGKPKKERKVKAEESIFSHFMQGYPEEELGMVRGITQAELETVESIINSMYELQNKEEVLKKGKELMNYLSKVVLRSGKYSEDIKKGLLTHIKRYVGKQVGKAIKGD